MAASSDQRLKEGDKLVAEAEKCLKTSWLKWRPDYDNAAHAFDKAALAYRNAKAYEKSRDTYERAADIHNKNHAMFHSGKAYEQAANVCKEMGAIEQAADFLQRASGRYHESGHPDTAGQVLIKAAKLVETVKPLQSAQYYLATAEIHEIEEKYRDAAKAVRGALNMYSRAREFDQMLECTERLKQLYEQTGQTKKLYEVAVIEVVVQLHKNNATAASMAHRTACSIPGFVDSDEGPVLDKLIESYQNREEEEFHECCDSAVFRAMDNEIAKLARDLKKQLTVGFDSPSHVPPLAAAGRQDSTGTSGLRVIRSNVEDSSEETNIKESSPVKEKSESSTVTTLTNSAMSSTPEVGGATTEKAEEEEEEDSDEDIL